MERTEVVVSINVHEKPDYLMGQLANIRENLRMSHRILISANEEMQGRIEGLDGFILNPTPINKRRHHGSITQGIVSNMRLARERLEFDWFLVMSSREFFYRPLNRTGQIRDCRHESRSNNYERNTWHWDFFKNTKLHSYIRERGLFLSDSPHEGLCFDSRSVDQILGFLDSHEDIKTDIFQFEWCVEEFALQSICCNFGDYYYLGNGTEELRDEQLGPSRFTRKLPR